MKRNGILNRGISDILAGMGHGQHLIVCDAGFPIPEGVPVIDLSLIKGYPTLQMVLEAIDSEFITEKVFFAEEVESNNPILHDTIKTIFSDADLEAINHFDILDNMSKNAKGIIRTGEYSPWGNIVLVSGTDPYLWFEEPSRVIPKTYKKRFEQVESSGKKEYYGHKNFKREI